MYATVAESNRISVCSLLPLILLIFTETDGYLVSSSKCKIIDLDPFSDDAKKYFKPLKYKACTKKDLLTFVTKQDNIATVHINQNVISQYSEGSLKCCYSNVSRAAPDANPDDFIK